jgi:pimeloyl-ACP methyl ester carboxylesterase
MANELSVLTPQLLDDFDIVMFDPRGVERSDPVSCGDTPGAPPSTLPDPVPTTPAQQATTINGLKQYATACEIASGTVLPYVGSVDVARDMDRLRQALGDAGLTFMGQSYGSLLGLTYASLFPTHVRAMVLDSVIDPALTFNQITEGQAEGFEGLLNAFFSWCASDATCPWRPAGDSTGALLAQIAASASSPVPAGNGRVAGAGELYDALLDGLYARSDWPQLGDALAADAQGDGAQIVAMSDHYNANGSTNGSDAEVAIDCLDHPVSHDLPAYAYLAAVLKASAPVFGPLLAWGEAGCAVWPDPPTRAVGPVSAPGAPDPGSRDHQRRRDALRLGGGRVTRAAPERPAHPRRGRARGVLLQQLRTGVRAVLPRERCHAAFGNDLHVVTTEARPAAGTTSFV